MAKHIGRFEIRAELGRGAQSVVYLAFDPQLQREVAVKTMHFSQAGSGFNEVLLAEARMVSPLRHPGIVPIFEAGEEQGDLYLVFEYVPGETLGNLIRRTGAMPPTRAADLMIRILDALAHAHSEGVIHRDLKPSNVLLTTDGLPRVMDFGIARRADVVNQAAVLSGTPAYMAPEYITRREFGERSDVFAAGVILIEMLTGKRLFKGDDVSQVMDRIAKVPASLPEGTVIDEAMGSIALRAVAHDPEQRFRSAAEFRDALQTWLNPPDELDAVGASSSQSTVDFLLRRMRHKSDFPALSESVSAINRIASSEGESVSKLSLSILRDFSLTNKILRLVNSVHYRPSGGGISTISRAVIVLGFESVRNIAITVLLLEHLQDKTNANYLKGEFLRANLAGMLARDIVTQLKVRDVEQVFICSVFNNLGRLLAQFYFPEESDEIRKLIAQKGVSELVAAQRVLGITFDELGMGIARSWGFPPLIVDSMARLPDGEVRKPHTPAERLRTLCAFANELCATFAAASPAEQESATARVLARFGESVPISRKQLDQSMVDAISEIDDFARIIRVNVAQTPFGQGLRRFRTGSVAGETRPAGGDVSLGAVALADDNGPALDTGEFPAPGQKAVDAQSVLTAGIQDISNTLVSDYKLNDILRIILETMYRAMGFNRVVLCIKDARTNAMQGRFGLGPEANEFAKAFRFSLSFDPDIFHAATSKGVDILITDIDDPKIVDRIPGWFRKATAAKTFVVFPLNIKSNAVALIYAEKSRAGDIEITEKELQLLRTLRNQALLAIKQGG